MRKFTGPGAVGQHPPGSVSVPTSSSSKNAPAKVYVAGMKLTMALIKLTVLLLVATLRTADAQFAY